MINFHFNGFADSQMLASQFESQLKADVDSYYSANLAMVYSNSTSNPTPFYSNGSDVYANGTDQDSNPYISDPSNQYGFLSPINSGGNPISDVEGA